VYSVTSKFLAAVRRPPAIVTRVEAWRGGVRVDPYADKGLKVYAGQVQVDGTKLTRRTLTGLRIDATDANWNLLSPVGTELRCFRGFRYGPGQSELVPVGRFTVDSLSETYGGGWDGTIDTAPDLMARVQRARFLAPRTFPAGTVIRTMISTLLSEVLGTVTVTATSTATLTSPQVYERDRLDTIDKACQSIGATVYIKPDGTPMLTDIPLLATTPVWTVNANADDAILYEATRQRSTADVYSAVSATPTQIDGAPPFAPQVAYDTRSTSPTYYLGPFGVVPYFMASGLFATAAQALAAAQARLPLVTAPHAQMDVRAECNPALEAFDTIAVVLPPRMGSLARISERQMLRTFDVPLTPDGMQSMTTMSSATDLEASA
jgi:hypothetical protein